MVSMNRRPKAAPNRTLHHSVGRYVTYFEAASDHLHVGAKSGVTGISVRRLGENPFLYAGYHYDFTNERYEYYEGYQYISNDYNLFSIEYSTTKAEGAIVRICFHLIDDEKFTYQAGMFAPLKIDGVTQTSQHGSGGQSGGGGQQGTGGQQGGGQQGTGGQQGGGQQGGGGQVSVDESPTLTGDTTLTYAENATGPVATYTATDPEKGQIVWSLSGTDGADFSIIRGDLTFNAGPDYEDPTDADTDNVYHVTVEVSDETNIVTLPVTVTVTNVNEPPQFPNTQAARSVADDTGAGENVGVPVEATDPEGDTLSYSLSGTDASSFDIATSTGQLLTKAALDSSSYSVTVSVTDGKNADGNADTATDDNIDVAITVTSATSTNGTSTTTLLNSIPRQLVPINGGPKTIVLSDHFSDSDDGYPPYQATTSDSSIATVEVSGGSLVITPKGIGVATTTLTVSDTPSISEEFKTIVYRPVVPRTNTERVHVVDPEVETILTSSDGRLSVTFPADAKDQFYQVAIDALSNNCGGLSPIGERRLCVLVDLFNLAAESIEESLDVAATLSVSLTQQQYNTVQTDLNNDEFTMWKGHGPTDASWDQIPQCAEPRGSSECFSLVQTSNGGKITVFNITTFSQFDAGLLVSEPSPPPTDPSPPTTTPPGDSGGSDSDSGNASRSDGYVYRSTPSIQIRGPILVDYAENGTDPVARYTIEETDVDEVIWSVYGERRPFTISADGVLSFKTPPDFENLSTLEGDTYWVQIHAEAPGSGKKDDVLNVYVTVTQVNEIGAISGDPELSVPENHLGAIARYRLDDPEKGLITWSLTGADAHGFEIDAQGSLSPAEVFDFEAPGSSIGTNVHTLTITATDDGSPALSSQIDVSVTVGDVNEAPVAAGVIPAVDLTTGQPPWTLDLGEFFTDPDGDSLTYETSGESSADVAVATVDGSTLSIAPVGEGSVSFKLAATDPGGLRASGAINVSVTDPTPAPVGTPAPAKVTEAVPTETPAVPTETSPPGKPAEASVQEPSPGSVLLSSLSERRYRNLAQQPDGVSKVIVAFAVEPVDSPPSELSLPPLASPPALPTSVRASDKGDAATVQGQAPLSLESGEVEGRVSTWLMVLAILVALVTVGYAVRMVVIHRVSQSMWKGLSRVSHRLDPVVRHSHSSRL